MDLPARDADNLLNELYRRVRVAGLRLTNARRAILRIMLNTDHPLSHRELARELLLLGIDQATGYRNLVTLSKIGLLNRNELGDHVWRFELRTIEPGHDSENTAEHPHLVCSGCGKVICLRMMNTELFGLLRRLESRIGEVHEVILKGCCTHCRSETSPDASVRS